MINTNGTPFLRLGVLAAAAVLAACDAPTDPAASAVAGGPSLLITPACAGTLGETHGGQLILTAQTWTRANSPHRVTGRIAVQGAGRLTVAPGAVVCFEPETDIVFEGGGRLTARGRDTAQILFTARDPALGWGGLQFSGTTSGPSYLTNVRVELAKSGTAVVAVGAHPVYVDSAVLRQNSQAVNLQSPGSRLARSVVDTTTSRSLPAVSLQGTVRFEETVVRGSAGVGVQATGADVLLLGGRIEGSRGTGLQISDGLPSIWSRAVRVVGGESYGAEMAVDALARLYPTPALQDSLLGNARDTLLVLSGTLRRSLTAGPRAPMRMHYTVVDSAGSLIAQPGASLAFIADGAVVAQNGGRIVSRGSAASPVLLTADDPARGWRGVTLGGTRSSLNYVTNTRLEHVALQATALTSFGAHQVIVDSSVIRYSGRAAALYSQNSRLIRTRVDTILDSQYPAVELGANVRIESTLIRASAGPGLRIVSGTVYVASCEIREGDGDGIVMQTHAVTVRNCNLVDNLGVGVRNLMGTSATATGNWWGSTGGPLGTGGDGVAGAVVYTPWRTTPFVLPYVP
jgi:hypothetical protein